MRSQRLERIEKEAGIRFPPPPRKGKMRVVKVWSARALSDEELDRRAARIPREPDEHRILINVVRVTSRRREPSAEVGQVEGMTSPAPVAIADAELTTAELERQVARLEAKKAKLIAARKVEGKTAELERRSRRVDEVKRAARNAEDRTRRKI